MNVDPIYLKVDSNIVWDQKPYIDIFLQIWANTQQVLFYEMYEKHALEWFYRFWIVVFVKYLALYPLCYNRFDQHLARMTIKCVTQEDRVVCQSVKL